MATNFTQAQLDDLVEAYTSGALEVTDEDGRKVRFRSTREIARVIGVIKQSMEGKRKRSFSIANPKRS